MAPEDAGPAGEPTFEKELENLERVVSLLERGDLDLEEAIRQYESGCQSLRKCYQILDNAKRRIEILAGAFDSTGPGTQGSQPAGESGGSPPGWQAAEIPEASPGGTQAPGKPKASN